MKIRVNMDSCKNALGTVFLLATAFFVCSTFMSMRSVFADPIVSDTSKVARNATVRPSGRVTRAPARTGTSRSTVARTTTAQQSSTTNNSTVSRSVSSRSVSSRTTGATRTTNAPNRNVIARQQNTNSNNRALRARTTSRVATTGSVMPAAGTSTRAGTTTYSYLSSKLYSGTYSSIIDSSTGLISADAYANCLSSYYACMDEICTARSDTKGRCACAGRARNFLEAEALLEQANEELITLSGQLSLLIATKGKGDDLAAAFSLTDAEKVMNCVSYRENVQTGKMTEAEWYKEHPTFTGMDSPSLQENGAPSYCSESGNNFGFDIANIDGSSSDILAQLKSWADAKDLAADYTSEDTNNLITKYMAVTNVVNGLAGIVNNTNSGSSAELDKLADKWGYQLFEYAHNNVCGRVLDSCFNGIYESCGNPGSITDSDGKTHSKCATGATSNCPFNYNSYITVNSRTGDVDLNERGSSNASESTVASCFGYTTTTTSSGVRTTTTSTTDPYYSVRGPVADARRSIMQKYLLDANSACDTYGAALKQTAQNINYQKIAAQQALQQKRLEFKQQEIQSTLSEATAAIDNFNECISEIWDCYGNYADEGWATARIKSYCSQVSQVPHCYETMICSPLQTQLTAVIDLPDSTNCNNDNDYTKNTCRNVVTISEILYGTGATVPSESSSLTTLKDSASIREACLQRALIVGDEECTASNANCLRGWKKPTTGE